MMLIWALKKLDSKCKIKYIVVLKKENCFPKPKGILIDVFEVSSFVIKLSTDKIICFRPNGYVYIIEDKLRCNLDYWSKKRILLGIVN